MNDTTIQTNKIYILDAIRSPIGKLYGSLTSLRPDDLAAQCIRSLLDRQPLAQQSEAVLLGCANQAGEDNRNLARMAVLLSGLSPDVSALTINNLCASGMDAILDAARRIALGEQDLLIAGGVDVMSRSPFVEHRVTGERVDSTIGWRFTNPLLAPTYQPLPMPQTAELLANKFGISRKAQDEYAFLSRQRYQQALDNQHYNNEMIVFDGLLDKDEQHRILQENSLEKLPPTVTDGQYISVGNSARIGDGAAMLLLASEQFLKKYPEIRPLCQITDWATAATHPDNMGIAPVAACRRILKKRQLTVSQIDRWELSEAFAAQLLACTELLGLDLEKVNPNGGELSMGKPLGSCGARLLVSLAWAMQREPSLKTAMAAVCAGLGTGAAVLLCR